MKKSLIALAVLAATGVASAQSAVTLFGVIDAAVSGYYNTSEDRNTPTLLNPTYQSLGSVTVSRTALTNSGYNSSRLGFRGTEDLGGGLAANFWLEMGVNNDDGTGQGIPGSVPPTIAGGLTFNRRATVSLSGVFGEVRLGRDYTPTFWNDGVFDPFGTNGVGTSLIATANGLTTPGSAAVGFQANANYIRASNSIGYFLPPNLGGFYGQVMYAFGEKDKYDPGFLTPPTPVNNSRTGGYVGGRFGYSSGPLDVAVAYGSSTVGDNYLLGIANKLNTTNLGASYDFGLVKLFGEIARSKLARDTVAVNLLPEPTADGYLFGATVPVGPGLIRMSYANVKLNRNVRPPLLAQGDDPSADKFAVGYVHNLSKRTALYATYAYLKDKDGLDITVGGPAMITSVNGVPFSGKRSYGYDIGIRHAF
ncbi:porin [Variovorax sp. J22P240]|uniref:porin n=1 Tax=Variovorax sp. J22P240 TaxID=3053514 RepID=UPI002574CD69|nr:porin [Variovorax sp. J22P240]MDM0000780.1 porin [Variovorax sp. J22P240]